MPELPIYGNSHVFILAQLCQAYGLRKVVISAGSRNAPLIKAFDEQEGIDTYIIPDERSAAYFAMGIAQFLREPVALICTSGTAALNYTPAVAEAFHQHRPLLLITADRPDEWIGQNDGQTIDQARIFQNFIGFEARLSVSIVGRPDLWHLERIVRDAFSTMTLSGKTAHLNVPLREPLYDLSREGLPECKATRIVAPTLNKNIELSEDLRKFKRILLVLGMQNPDPALKLAIQSLISKKQLVILSENLSNIGHEGIFSALDGLLVSVKAGQSDRFNPDLIISFGQMLVSKPLKQWLRTQSRAEHWVVTTSNPVPDTFRKIDKIIRLDSNQFLEALNKLELNTDSEYVSGWIKSAMQIDLQTLEYSNHAEWSDFKVFGILSKAIQNDGILHLGNSSVVRYAQFFAWHKGLKVYGNRGTAGIDGATSTALGMSSQTDEPVTLITGDVGFLYDSNAFWNAQKRGNFRVILINNGGGNIFDLINGPSDLGISMDYFRTDFKVDIGSFCNAYGVRHLEATNEDTLKSLLVPFFSTAGPVVLEIKTNADTNARVWKQYFASIKNMK